MNFPAKRLFFPLLAFISGLFLQSPAFGQTGSADSSATAAATAMATGHSYVGVDLGLTGSTYIGSKNFLWGIQTAPSLGTYLPYNNLGTGIGFVGGIKGGFKISQSFDIEAKLRYITNHTSKEEIHPGIILLPGYPNNATGTDNYSLTLSSIDFALLGHLRLNDQFYAIAGASASTLITNRFSAHQVVAGQYLRLTTRGNSNISEQSGDSSLVNWFTGYRGDIQVGIGSVYRIGSSDMLLDAELLVSIPLTTWLTKAADSSLNSTAKFWLQPTDITDPKLWYLSLTFGLRLPFSPLPPPPIEYHPAQIETPSLSLSGLQKTDTATGGTMLSGRVIDAQTGKPVSANLTAVDLADNKTIWTGQTDSNGYYSIPVKGPGKFSVTANKNGYLFGTSYFEVDSNGRILNSHGDIKLDGFAGGKTRLLVFFALDKADLQPSSTPELNRAVELMKSVPSLKVEIAGYSDSTGTFLHNKTLSLQRANSVRDYLVSRGIDGGRITAQGYGSESPIAPNSTEEGRAENRRVEFVVTAH